MRNLILAVTVCLVVSLVLPSLSAAQQPPTQTLRVMLNTQTQAPMKIPGMPNLPQMPGMGTQHTVSAVAVYAKAAVEPIFLTVPADLKLRDNRLVLHVEKPGGGEGAEGKEEKKEEETKAVEVTTKIYWHPDEAQGPITETFKSQAGQAPGMGKMSTDEFSRIMGEFADREATGSESKLPQTVKGQGDYVLNTGGQATLDGFLGPLKLSSPDMSKLDLAKPITVQWEALQGARGYFILATGMNMDDMGEDTMKMTNISWYSTLQEPPVRVRGGYVQETTIAADLESGVLLPDDTTKCVIPGGIFKGVNMLTLRVQAIGNDFYSNTGGVTVFGTIRSEWHGMGMIQEVEMEDEGNE